MVCLVTAAVLTALGVLKWWTTCSAIWWLRRHGREYRREVERCVPSSLNGAEFRRIAERFGGGRLWPWGILELKLIRRSWVAQTFASKLFRLPTLPGLALAAYLFGYDGSSSRASAVLWTALAFVLQIDVVLMGIEGVVAYAAVGAFRRYYHVGIRLASASSPDLKDDLFELDAVFPVAASSVLANIFAVVNSGLAWHSFALPSTHGLRHPWDVLAAGGYFVSTTMTTVGYGDIAPKGMIGEAATVLIQVHALLLVVGLFSALMSFGVVSAGMSRNQDGSLEDSISPKEGQSKLEPKKLVKNATSHRHRRSKKTHRS